MSNANDFIIENGVLKKYIGPGGDVVIPNGVIRIQNFGFGYVTSVTLPEGVESIAAEAFRGNMLKKVILPESLKDVGFNVFGDYSHVEYIGSKETQKVQSEGKRTIVCSDELLSVLWSGICADWKREICYYQLQKQGQTDEKMAPVVKTYVSKNKKTFLDLIYEVDDDAALESFFTVGKKPTLDMVEAYVESAHDKFAIKAFLLGYIAKNFVQDDIQLHHAEKAEKTLGLRELSIADWRKIYVFKTENGIARISAYKGTDTDVTVPLKIGKYDVVLGDNVFRENKIVERVHIMPEIEELGTSFFYNCPNLKEVIFPKTLKRIGDYAMQSCTALTKVELPNGVTEIGEGAFAHCSVLSSVILPKGIDQIGEYAFAYCWKLTDISVPAAAKLGAKAFYHCDMLADSDGFVIVNGTLFHYINNAKDVYVPDGVKIVDQAAIESWVIETVHLPNSVTTIEKNSLTGRRLEKVWIPASTKKIKAGAFKGAYGIPDKLVIHLAAGSAAEKYAAKYNIPFIAE